MEYKINTLLPVQFEKIENPPYLNDSRFQAVRVYLAHEKENYNGSYFDASVLEAMGKKMAGVPIVGYISVNNVNEKDFNGHEQRLIIDDNGVSIEYLGRAYGCVLSNDDVTIVDRMHEDGKMRKYLCVTGVLWKMFADCVDIFDRDTSKAHSMELQEDSIKGKFEKDGYYHFTEATVRALCILGEGILPAMSNSVIEKFSQDDINFSIQELLKEVNDSIKQYSQNQNTSVINLDDSNFNIDSNRNGGKEIVEEKLKLLAEYNLKQEDLSFSIEEISLEDLDKKLKEEYKKNDNIAKEFSATYRQKRDALQNALDPKIEKDSDGNITYEEYLWIEDFDDQYAYVEKSIWTPDNYERKYGRFTYTFDEESITATITGEFEEMVLVWLTLEENKKLQEERAKVESDYSQLQKDFEDYKNNYSTANDEVERLKRFESTKLADERKESEDALFEQFSELNGIEDFEILKKDASKFEIYALEKECFAILGKKNAKFSTNKSVKKDKVKIEFTKSENKTESGYDELFNKYLNKEDK